MKETLRFMAVPTLARTETTRSSPPPKAPRRTAAWCGGADTGISQEKDTDTGALALGAGLAMAALGGGAYAVRRRNVGAAA